MKTQSLKKVKKFHQNTSRHSTNIITDNSESRQSIPPPSSLKTKIFSFQDLGSSQLLSFCTQFHHIHSLTQVGKRITDPNVLMMNSTQKQIVEMIIENNRDSNDSKSKFIKQRAGKYLKVLWKSEKYNDSILQRQPKIEKQPHYTSPIHHFKKHKLTGNNSFGSLSIQTNGSDHGLSKRRSPIKKQPINTTNASKDKRIHSEDTKFQHIRLSPRQVSKKDKPIMKQKSFQIDLTQNLAWKTMNVTKNFENMLKILKRQQ